MILRKIDIVIQGDTEKDAEEAFDDAVEELANGCASGGASDEESAYTYTNVDANPRFEEIAKAKWNSSADEFNQWPNLGSDEKIKLINAAMQYADAIQVLQPAASELADKAEWLSDKIMGNEYIIEAAELLRKMAPIVRNHLASKRVPDAYMYDDVQKGGTNYDQLVARDVFLDFAPDENRVNVRELFFNPDPVPRPPEALMQQGEPTFEALVPEQEDLAVKFCEEIAGKKGEKPSLPDPVRLLEMAQALYAAERNAVKGSPSDQVST